MSSHKPSTLFNQRFQDMKKPGPTESDGFVDEDVVLEMITGGSRSRVMPASRDLALPAEDIDFAGWTMPEPLPSRFTPPSVSTSPIQNRPTPARTWQKETPPPRENIASRWWFACLVGITFSLSLGALLFALVDRGLVPWGGIQQPAEQDIHQPNAMESTTGASTAKPLLPGKSD